MNIYLCDRCGKKIDIVDGKVAVAAAGTSRRCMDPYCNPCYDVEYDLCDDCMKGLKEYMKGETNGGTETNL